LGGVIWLIIILPEPVIAAVFLPVVVGMLWYLLYTFLEIKTEPLESATGSRGKEIESMDTRDVWAQLGEALEQMHALLAEVSRHLPPGRVK
jgi:hypothetical protein